MHSSGLAQVSPELNHMYVRMVIVATHLHEHFFYLLNRSLSTLSAKVPALRTFELKSTSKINFNFKLFVLQVCYL